MYNITNYTVSIFENTNEKWRKKQHNLHTVSRVEVQFLFLHMT